MHLEKDLVTAKGCSARAASVVALMVVLGMGCAHEASTPVNEESDELRVSTVEVLADTSLVKNGAVLIGSEELVACLPEAFAASKSEEDRPPRETDVCEREDVDVAQIERDLLDALESQLGSERTVECGDIDCTTLVTNIAIDFACNEINSTSTDCERTEEAYQDCLWGPDGSDKPQGDEIMECYEQYAAAMDECEEEEAASVTYQSSLSISADFYATWGALSMEATVEILGGVVDRLVSGGTDVCASDLYTSELDMSAAYEAFEDLAISALDEVLAETLYCID